MLYFHYYQERNIKNVLERTICAFLSSIKTGHFSKNLRMKSSFNSGMAAGLNVTSNTFTVIILLQCFPLYKQGGTILSPKQPEQSKTAAIVLNYFPTLSKTERLKFRDLRKQQVSKLNPG